MNARASFHSTLVCLVATVLTLAGAAIVGAQTLSRVSVDSGGAQVSADSTAPSMSADGRYIAFVSGDSTLVSGDTNASTDVFVKDRQTGAVERVSVASDGTQALGDSWAPSISADGRYVAFTSYAALVTDDIRRCLLSPTIPTCADIYVRDRLLNTTTRASIATDGSEANAGSDAAVISADGRYVAFQSDASNLVASDTNTVTDIFLRDRIANTTTRLSVSTSGIEGNQSSLHPLISDDGRTVAFLSLATNFDSSPDSLRCTDGSTCYRLFIRDVPGAATTRAALTEPLGGAFGRPGGTVSVGGDPNAITAAISRDGNTIAVQLTTDWIHTPARFDTRVQVRSLDVILYDLAHRRTTRVTGTESTQSAPPEPIPSVALDTSGRRVAVCIGSNGLLVEDLFVQLESRQPVFDAGTWTDCTGVGLTADGNQVVFASREATVVANDTNGRSDVFIFDRDQDRDGIPYEWEIRFGFDPNNPADAALDPDNDGKTNLQEFQEGSHPKGTFVRYLAEGAQNDFFSTGIAVFNPDPNAPGSGVVARYLGDNGETRSRFLTVAPETLTGASPLDVPSPSFSTIIESDHFLAVERTMTWPTFGQTVPYGSSAETAITNPSTTWFFAEGATHGSFDLFYLLQNPGDHDASVTITYLLPAPQAPIVLTYDVTAHSRRTIYVDQEPGLGATDVSARIDSTQPIFAERSMYLSTPDQPFAGGTGGAGIAAAATKWFIAEGATGGFFDLYILIGNPSDQDATVTITYLLPDGSHFDKTYPVARLSRRTIAVDGEDARLADTSVSAVVTSTNGVPIIVERSMWWPSPNWYEGSLTAATTETATKWALAGGRTGFRPEDETYLLVANPGDADANVTFSLVVYSSANGGTPYRCIQTVRVPAHGRQTSGIKDICTTQPYFASIAGTVTSDGPGIVVERATYGSTDTQFWAAGASTLLTKMP
jgi:hypothetical protein